MSYQFSVNFIPPHQSLDTESAKCANPIEQTPSSAVITMQIGGTHYDDWLEGIRQLGGEFAWIRHNNLASLQNAGRGSHQIRAAVLGSSKMKAPYWRLLRIQCAFHLQAILSQLARERGLPESSVGAEAEHILGEMAHDFRLHSAVQPIGYSLAKIFARLFSHIWINTAQMERIAALSRDTSVPVIWLPTHRSYIDFLLLSMLSYGARIQLPAICAAEDFRASRLMGEALRRCGAFFIRRSFKEDALYWAVFAEYVQQLVAHRDRPLEFFVEGQRSRTGKSVYPRTGLLQLVLEPFLRAQLLDTILVPLTIDYDRVLETELYARELIGIPKPREQLSALLRARRVLADNFGEVHVTVGEPISLRRWLLDNGTSLVDPRLEMRLTDGQPNVGLVDECVRRLALQVVALQNAQRVLSPLPFVALALLQSMPPCADVALPMGQLERRAEALLALAEKCLGSARLRTRTHTVTAEVRHFLSLHHSHFCASSDSVHLVPVRVDTSAAEGSTTAAQLPLLPNAVQLANCANPAIAALAPFCFLSIAQIGQERRDKSAAIYQRYCALRELFDREFVHEPGSIRAELLRISAPFARLTGEEHALLAQMMAPFLCALHSIFSFFASLPPLPQQELLRRVQSALVETVRRQSPSSVPMQVVSSDLAKNAFHWLKARKMAILDDRQCVRFEQTAELDKWRRQIEQFLLDVTHGTTKVPLPMEKAKL